MCPGLLSRHDEVQKHRTAASCFMRLGQRREPEGRERAATLRRNKAIILAVTVLVFLASGATAQVPETIPPVLSSGLRAVTPVQTQAIGKPRQSASPQSSFDAANLTPMGSIDSEAGIRPSLAGGMPTHMTGAALRRAWSTDPAIRDFIGLSENSWDFDAAGGVPGFGSVTRDDARRLLARVVGETKSVDAEQPAAEQLAHGQVLSRTGEAAQAPSNFALVK
jgi:uncharacterized protein DUF3306